MRRRCATTLPEKPGFPIAAGLPDPRDPKDRRDPVRPVRCGADFPLDVGETTLGPAEEVPAFIEAQPPARRFEIAPEVVQQFRRLWRDGPALDLADEIDDRLVHALA